MLNCNRYRLRISGNDYKCIEANGEKASHFIAPDTKNGKQKLYIVKNGSEICYVGIASRSMSSRLRNGFKAAGKNGYYGYKWKGKLKQAELLVYCFHGKELKYVEAIEGELVYFIRKKTGKWPKYQMEIHFHSEATESQKQVARSILAGLFN